MPEHPAIGLGDRRPGWHPAEVADLDPLGVDGGHGGFDVTELLLLLGVEPALTHRASVVARGGCGPCSPWGGV